MHFCQLFLEKHIKSTFENEAHESCLLRNGGGIYKSQSNSCDY